MENEKKLGSENVYPITEEQMDRIEQYPQFERMAGISKRLLLAGMAMQGILANNPRQMQNNIELPDLTTVARESFAYADELLAQEKL